MINLWITLSEKDDLKDQKKRKKIRTLMKIDQRYCLIDHEVLCSF